MSRYNEVFAYKQSSFFNWMLGTSRNNFKTFKNAKIPIRISSTIIPNKVNIIIEDFSNDLTIEIARISKMHPNTKFVLYVTESYSN